MSVEATKPAAQTTVNVHTAATLSLPVSRSAVRGVELPSQFPIGNPERWGKIVDNLAILVATLDRSFVPEIEAIAGPSPEWFRPET